MHIGVRTPGAKQTRAGELAALRIRPRCTKCFITSPGLSFSPLNDLHFFLIFGTDEVGGRVGRIRGGRTGAKWFWLRFSFAPIQPDRGCCRYPY